MAEERADAQEPGKSPVGFIGVGNMGRRMAANLAAAGFPLVVRDSDPGAQQRFIDAFGGTPGDAPRDFAGASVGSRLHAYRNTATLPPASVPAAGADRSMFKIGQDRSAGRMAARP